MQLAQHYLALRQAFPQAKDGEPFAVSLQQVAERLFCTSRNANLILRKCSEAGWLQWSPGKGRGHLSSLSFCISSEQILLTQAIGLAEKGELPAALTLINNEPVSRESKEQFFGWLSERFGFHTERGEQAVIDTLRFPLKRKLRTLDPMLATYAIEGHLIRHIFDSLTRYNPERKRIEPHLAHYWEANEERTEWLFYLRKGVLYHHGREMTANDVVSTLQRLCDPAFHSPFQPMFDGIERVEMVDNLTVRLILREPNYLLPHLLCSHAASILPADLWQRPDTDFHRQPVGTGPFRVGKHDDAVIVLEAFPSYFQGRAHLDRIEIWIIPDYDHTPQPLEPTFQMRYLSSRPDSSISPDWKKVERNQSGGKLLYFNLNRKGPVQHLAFRRALQHAVDRTRLITDRGDERLMPADRFLPHLPPAPHLQERQTAQIPAWLHQAGYSGERVILYAHEQDLGDAMLIRQHCHEHGIRLEVETYPSKDCLVTPAMEHVDLLLTEQVFDDDVMLALLETYLATYSLLCVYLDQERQADLRARIRSVLAEPNPLKQYAGLLNVEEWLIEQGVLLPLYRKRQITYYHPALKGVSLSSFGWVCFKEIWFQRGTT